MRKLTSRYGLVLLPEHIGQIEGTGGTETSKYPEERKVTTTPLVAASETGRAQTVSVSSLMALLTRGSGILHESIRSRTELQNCHVEELTWKGGP